MRPTWRGYENEGATDRGKAECLLVILSPGSKESIESGWSGGRCKQAHGQMDTLNTSCGCDSEAQGHDETRAKGGFQHNHQPLAHAGLQYAPPGCCPAHPLLRIADELSDADAGAEALELVAPVAERGLWGDDDVGAGDAPELAQVRDQRDRLQRLSQTLRAVQRCGGRRGGTDAELYDCGSDDVP